MICNSNSTAKLFRNWGNRWIKKKAMSGSKLTVLGSSSVETDRDKCSNK